MVGRTCLLALGLVLGAVQAAGQEATGTIDLGVVKLYLGMEEQAAMDALREVYLVEKRPRGNDWVVFRRDRVQVIGSILFSESGQLIAATKFRTQEIAGTAVELAGALHAAIWELTRDGKKSCNISTEEAYDPLEMKIAYIECGKQVVEVTLFRTYEEVLATGERRELWLARVAETLVLPSAMNRQNTSEPR